MKGIAQSLTASLIGFNLPFMILAVVLSAFNTKIDVLSMYLTGSTIDQAWITYITYFPVIQISGVFFGLLLSKVRRSRLSNPEILVQSKFFSQILMFAFFIVLVNIFLSEVVLTGAKERQDLRIVKTKIITQLLDEALAAEKKADIKSAHAMYSEILSIEPNHKVVRGKYEETSHTLKNIEPESIPVAVQPEFSVPTDVVEILDKAQKFLDEKDYYSAHYYANLALKLNPKNNRGTEISKTAWKAITDAASTGLDKDKNNLYERKKAAYSVMLDNNFTESYYLFQQLAVEAPEDKDIQRYLTESETNLKTHGFFIEEAENYAMIPGTLNILFLNPAFKEGNEYISIRKCVYTIDSLFAYDLEILRQDAGGKTMFHIKTPYAKIQSGNLIYYAVSKGAEQRIQKPLVLAGELPASIKYFLKIDAERTMIPSLIPQEGRPASTSILSLWTLYRTIGKFGFNYKIYLLEMVRRVGLLFNFLFFMIISIALAMKFIESDKRKPSIASLIFAPVVLVSVTFTTSLFNFGFTALAAYLTSTFPLTVTIIVFVIMQVILQFFGFFYLAGQKTLS